ncbi:MAG: DNA translocase FtsK 4TM domain-containing protein [Ignavibacteriaceae bacterium]|nr:DNA translocase FtsK 4TM domain-containing protein [Ignavibacteriaceae bacterium]
MAKKESGKTNNKQEKDYFVLTEEHKRYLSGLFLFLFSLLIFLSIVTFSRADEGFLNFRTTDVFTPQEGKPSNLLGIAGAYMAYFFVRLTIGYFSVVFPAIFFFFAISFFKEINSRIKIYSVIFFLLSGLLFSTLFGVLRIEFDFLRDYYELSGNIGQYTGTVLDNVLGGFASTLILITLIIVLIVFTFNIRISNIVESLQSGLQGLREKGESEDAEEGGDEKLEKEKDNKPAKEAKPKNGKTPVIPVKTTEQEEEEKKETQIRISRKEEALKQEKTVPEPKAAAAASGLASGAFSSASAEVKSDDVPVNPVARDEEIKLPDQWEEKISYKRYDLERLNAPPKEDNLVVDSELQKNAAQLKDKLAMFDIEIEDINVRPGPVITLYELKPAPGVKISKIVSLEHDIALALAARGIRIIAPIPGKSVIGVEIPNSNRSLVVAKQVLPELDKKKFEVPLALGKDIAGDIYVADLVKMPHLLIAGSTGSGKSVGVNMMISSILYAKHPSEVKFAIIDPKKIELTSYHKLRNHYLAVCPDLDEDIATNATNAVILLKSITIELDRRLDKLARMGAKNIGEYNHRIEGIRKPEALQGDMKHFKMPYIIVIVDELADLMITSGKEVEEPICRLAQMARAVGIHLIIATQRPSVNVITGVIKANFNSRIAYQVATKIDSRTILDMNGAEQLIGHGDMLFMPPGSPKPLRIQNAYISTDEIDYITNHIYSQKGYSKPYYLPSVVEGKGSLSNGDYNEALDPLFEDAARIVVSNQQGSVSLLQRRLKLGYSRAARIVDQLEVAKIVGPNDGSKAREVLVNEEQLEAVLRQLMR